MNDRFKFRIWDKPLKKYMTFAEFRFMNVELTFNPETKEAELEFDKERYVVEQCTGLKDKNGKFIYDGDIVTDGQDNGRIYWENTGWACTMFLWQKKPEELEVIGNINENKELIQ